MAIDWDMFFYYGTDQLDQNDEDEFDVLQGLMQPLRSLLYFRREGTGIKDDINMPGSLSNYILTRMNVVKWFAFRNGYVVDGRDDFPDRRLLTSQNIIGLIEEAIGSIKLLVFYIPFRSYESGVESLSSVKIST